MSRQQAPPFARKSSTPWDRLRPIKQDPLEAVGFVSKGDNRLIDIKAQESFYHKIVARYMQFCSHHTKDLDAAFASLSSQSDASASSDATTNPPVKGTVSLPLQTSTTTSSPGLSASRWASNTTTPSSVPPPADELSMILMALRKLREGLLATSSNAPSPVFSQRVHIFNIRVAILALHPPSYHPSLSYLLSILHSKDFPLPGTELKEMTTYLILDLALRQKDLVAAYETKHNSQKRFGYESSQVDRILRAVVTGNWVDFWRIRREVDGYIRAMMHWHIESLRKTTLKVFGKSYMRVDAHWLLKSVAGSELTWLQLVEKENVGWSLDGENVVIRKPKTKP